MKNTTEKNFTEEVHLPSENRFQTAFANASVGMCIVGLDGVFLEVNAKLSSLIGYRATDLVGQPVSAFTYPADLALRNQFVNDLTDGKMTSGQQERRFIRCDGSVAWTLISSSLQKDQDGRPLYFISLVQDITERKKAEEQLLLARFCIEHASVAIMRVAEDAGIIDVNGQACRSLGYSREDLLGMTIFDIDPSCSLEKWAAHQNKLTVERIHVIQTEYRRKDGTQFPVEITSNHFEMDGHSFSFLFIRDISSRIEAERNRKKIEAQFLHAQKMEAIGTLAGGIAHDFNNILSVIIGNSNILELSEFMVQEDLRSVQQIVSAADRAKQLVAQIMTFSRQSEQQRLVISLKAVVEETFNFLKAMLPSSIEVCHRIETEKANILGDPTQIQQVIMNLCTNAAQAMEGHENGKLEIRLERTLLTNSELNLEIDVEPGEYVKLSVTDTGAGIDTWVQQRIFEPYFTTKNKGKGTGLGLSVVHGIVHNHGGFIKVYSEPGQGTSFQIFFPVSGGDTHAVTAIAREAIPTGTENLLFVDDEIAVAEMTQRMLEKLGYCVSIRTSPFEAIEAFSANPKRFQAVVTDMTMPQMSGIKLAARLLKINPNLPILLCTGFSDLDKEAKIRGSGVREIIFKPLTLFSLANTLRKMIDNAA